QRESQPASVQKLTFQRQVRSLTTVERVRSNRMLDKRAMHANLVRSPCLDVDIQQRIAGQTLDHTDVRYGWATVANDCHALAVMRITSDWCIDRRLVIGNIAEDECRVLLHDRALLPL